MELIRKLLSHTLFRNMGCYAVADIINKAVPFLLLPILVRVFSPVQYGYLSLFIAALSIGVVLQGLNMQVAVMRGYFLKEEGMVFSDVMSVAVFISVLCFIFYGLLALSLHGYLLELTGLTYKWLAIALVASFCWTICSLHIAIFQVHTRPMAYAYYQISQTMLNVGLSLFLVLVIKMGWHGRAIGFAFALTVYGLYSFVYLARKGYLHFHFSKQALRFVISFTLPLFPSVVAFLLITTLA